MLVSSRATIGTVGGGKLEFDAIAHARRALKGASVPDELRFALGPKLGQCCGGVVWLRFERIESTEELDSKLPKSDARPLALFGAGHVGAAIARIALELPLALHWIDSRPGQFANLPCNIGWRRETSEPAAWAVSELTSGAAVLIMSHSHAEDFDILMACLKRQRAHRDLSMIGLIGSRTKWASFRQRLMDRGFTEAELTQVTCPIGAPEIRGKEPAVIAIAVLAQVLALRQ